VCGGGGAFCIALNDKAESSALVRRRSSFSSVGASSATVRYRRAATSGGGDLAPEGLDVLGQ